MTPRPLPPASHDPSPARRRRPWLGAAAAHGLAWAMLAAAGCAVEPDADEYSVDTYEAATNELVIQAETGALTPPMRRGNDGRSFIETTTTDYTGARSGAASYTFTAPVTADYAFAITAEAFGPTYNSVFFQLDDDAPMTLAFGEEFAPEKPYNRYLDYDVTTKRLTAGSTHRITIRGREQFTRIDVIRARYAAAAPVKPRVAGFEYTWSASAEQAAADARFGLMMIDKRNKSLEEVNAFARAVKAINPSIRMGSYTMFYELPCNVGRVDASQQARFRPWIEEANRAGFWLRTAAGAQTSWTGEFGACDMNLTPWGARNAAGQTWVQYMWARFRELAFGAQPALDYVMFDNVFAVPRERTRADYKRQGVDLDGRSPEIATALRQGYRALFDLVRQTNPTLKLFGNTDNDLGSAEYKGQLEGALLENMITDDPGHVAWAMDRLVGWDAMRQYYHRVMQNTRAPHDVMFNVYTARATSYAVMRYGLATSMLDDGYFALRVGGTDALPWYDEYDAPIGAASEPPPTQAFASGVWRRRYDNGLVLVNPTNATVQVDVGAGYRRLGGNQDRAVNTGAVERVVTLPAHSGLLMLKSS